jgi:hypothetical protein
MSWRGCPNEEFQPALRRWAGGIEYPEGFDIETAAIPGVAPTGELRR